MWFELTQLLLFLMQVQSYFRTATALFYQGNHEQAIMAIDRYIRVKPSSSLAYSNRALMHFHLGQTSKAREDISVALQLNHLNYVAYFNLFSVQYKQKEYAKSLLALCGALSTLYLIKGRLQKDKQLLGKALHFSSDNFDALLLLVLLEVNDQKYREALMLIDVYQTLNQNHRILKKMRALITQLQVGYSQTKEEVLYDYLLDNAPQQHVLSGKGLDCSASLEEELREVIQAQLKEFNILYADLNQRMGGASYLIAKVPEKQRQEPVEEQIEETQQVQKKQIMAMI